MKPILSCEDGQIGRWVDTNPLWTILTIDAVERKFKIALSRNGIQGSESSVLIPICWNINPLNHNNVTESCTSLYPHTVTWSIYLYV
jgi:hypothetical protein